MNERRSRWPGESLSSDVLDVADIRDDAGRLRFRISRYFSSDGIRWVCHGPFVMYHENGEICSEGEYRDGLEHGNWRTYYEGGQIAAEGYYFSGKEEGYWSYWTRTGVEQQFEEYQSGVLVGPDPDIDVISVSQSTN